MSEFKFEVGTRVAVRCDNHGHFRGTISGILKSYNAPYCVKPDNDAIAFECRVFEKQLTRLVKKKKESADDFKDGQRVSAKHDNGDVFTGIVIGHARNKSKHWVQIRNDLNSPWCNSDHWIRNHRCKLIEDEKPKPKQRQPLRVGERVVVRFKTLGTYTSAKDGQKGVIEKINLSDGDALVNFDDEEMAKQNIIFRDIKRLIKKPVAFKVGDRVLVKAIMGLGERSYTPFKTTVMSVRGDRLKVKDVFDNSLSFFDWAVLAKDCVKLRKRRLRVGDRVNALTFSLGTKITGEIIRDDKSDVPFFVLIDKTGLLAWAKEKDCKRLVRKKKAKKRFDTFKILMESLAYFKLINKNHVPASVKKVDESDHIASAGKKVEGEFCECKHEGLVAMKGDKHVDCGKTFDFMRYRQSKKSESEFCECENIGLAGIDVCEEKKYTHRKCGKIIKQPSAIIDEKIKLWDEGRKAFAESEFCECEDIRVYDSITKTHTGYKNHSGCGKPIKEFFSFVQQCSNCHGSGIESVEKK